MQPNGRRNQIIEVLNLRRFDTMSHLASEFGVSVHTIWRDILQLSQSYPLFTSRGRYGGGVKVADGFYLSHLYLTKRQKKLLVRLMENLQGEDAEIMQEILQTFARK